MTKRSIRILIADDHAVVRKGLAMVLRLDPDIEIVGEAGDGKEALKLVRRLSPDVILLDRIMPEMTGEETAKAIKEASPDTRVVILTGTEFDEGVLEILSTGVDGYVLKDIEPDELINAIHAVYQGEAYLHTAVTRQVLDRLAKSPQRKEEYPLTPRELEVLQWMTTPYTYKEIAVYLSISEETVRSHAKNILNKLNQPNRAQAAQLALRKGLVELKEDD